MRMATVLHRLGYLAKGHLVAVTRDELVGQYIGHTAPKTREVLKRAMGGVLFIDEAYYLHRQENERDYGQEAIEILLQVMENQRNDIVVILAGYRTAWTSSSAATRGWDTYRASHPTSPTTAWTSCSRSRGIMLDRQRYTFSSDAEPAFRELMARRMPQPRFANARSVRNATGAGAAQAANRLISDGKLVTRDDLMRIEPLTSTRGRWFTEAGHDEATEVRAVPAL